MDSKVKIRVGDLEIEYEGSERFLKEEFPVLLENVSTLFQARIAVTGTSGQVAKEGDVLMSNESNTQRKIQGTTNTIASRLGVKTGPDLIIAAAAHLTFVKSLDRFDKKDLLEQAQSVSSFSDQSVCRNFSSYLSRLVKSGRISEVSKDVYALTMQERQKLEEKLSNT
jgi:hypothetical protein